MARAEPEGMGDAAARAGRRLQRAAARAERRSAAAVVEAVGQAANGLVHILIGGLAAAIAVGAGAVADQTGAMAAIERTALGGPLLWVVGLALVGLALHAFLVAAARSRSAPRDALRAAGRGIGHAAVGSTALVFAVGGRIDGEETAERLSAALLEAPWGPWVLGAIGLVVAGVGIAFVVRGVRRRFFEDIAPPRRFRRLVEALGTPGFVAKGVAVLIVGALLVVAAVRAEPEQAGGLDGALQSLTTVPGGVVALVAIAVGLVVYGAYLVARGIWAR